jgi:hypothetical protein
VSQARRLPSANDSPQHDAIALKNATQLSSPGGRFNFNSAPSSAGMLIRNAMNVRNLPRFASHEARAFRAEFSAFSRMWQNVETGWRSELNSNFRYRPPRIAALDCFVAQAAEVSTTRPRASSLGRPGSVGGRRGSKSGWMGAETGGWSLG